MNAGCEAIQKGGKHNRTFQVGTKFCYRILGSWELQTMRNLLKYVWWVRRGMFEWKKEMFKNKLKVNLLLRIWVKNQSI